MELGPGYKQTEVGVIPEDWDVVQIGDLKPFVTSGSRGWAAFYSDRGAPFIRITNLSRNSIYLDLADLRLVNLPKTDTEGARTQIEHRDVLISITADIGIVGYVSLNVPRPAYINQHIALVRFEPSATNSKFISYSLASGRSQKLFRSLTDSGAKAGMGLTTVGKIRVTVPPTKAEQDAIAEALSDADALIESLEQLIAKKRNLKQGAMQELLFGKRRLPGFGGAFHQQRATDGGPLPGDWEDATLGACLSERPSYGINAPAAKYRDNLPTYIRITDITDDGHFSRERLASVNAANAADYFLEDGDLVFARTGASVGKSYRYLPSDGRLVFAGFLIRIRPNSTRLNPSFLGAFVTTWRYWNWVRLMSMRSGQPGINGNEYAQMSIPLPTIKEQTAIAAILTDMDAEIAALEAKLAKARQLKQGMMHNLLTGRIRLV